MCLALAAYENRIASLFESSNRFVIMDRIPYDLKNSASTVISNNSVSELIKILRRNNVTELICGAINGNYHHILESEGIRVIPWITGDIQSVVKAYQMRSLFSPTFTMPGCRKRGRFRRRGFNRKM